MKYHISDNYSQTSQEVQPSVYLHISRKYQISILIKVSRLQNFTEFVFEKGPQGLLMGPKGPTDRAEGCIPPQELEKAREAGYFSSQILIAKLPRRSNPSVYLHLSQKYLGD